MFESTECRRAGGISLASISITSSSSSFSLSRCGGGTILNVRFRISSRSLYARIFAWTLSTPASTVGTGLGATLGEGCCDLSGWACGCGCGCGCGGGSRGVSLTIFTVVLFFACEGSVTMSGLTSPGGLRGDAEGVVAEADAGGGVACVGGGSGRTSDTIASSSTIISGRASS